MRGADLASPFWGVRTPDHDAGLLDLCRAYLERAHPSVFFSHVTAAQIHGIRLPTRLTDSDILDVAVPFPKRAQLARGIRGHKLLLRPGDITMAHGLPVSRPERTWCDIAGLLTDEELLAAGDSLLWWRKPLATPESVAAALGQHRAAGRAALLRVAPWLSARSDSTPESVLRWRFRLAGLPEPIANLQLCDTTGVPLLKPDLAFPEYREAVDYEGDHHRTDPAQWQRDIKRGPMCESIGWHLTRAAADDLRDSRALIGLLQTALRKKGWRG
jgi:hypothetical protein